MDRGFVCAVIGPPIWDFHSINLSIELYYSTSEIDSTQDCEPFVCYAEYALMTLLISTWF